VVQRILDRLHGTVQVSSAPGQGTAFQIFLPSEATGASDANPASSVATETLQPVHATILVVDDEELLRQAVSKILRRHGFSVMEASDGSAALDALRAHRDGIDLLVLDITLPGASSREVYYEARQLKPGLPVIVISAKSEEMAGNSLGTKVEHFLRKPFLSVDLIDRIQTALASVKAARKLRGSLSAGAR
jgi:DNA-binding response OmpR family regulator